MTDDEYTIQETRAMSAREVRKILQDERMREVRRTSGITEEILKASTTGGCIVAMQIGETPVFKAFTMALPGVPDDEQRALLRRFEDLWRERRMQLARAVDFIDSHYDLIEKEEVE